MGVVNQDDMSHTTAPRRTDIGNVVVGDLIIVNVMYVCGYGESEWYQVSKPNSMVKSSVCAFLVIDIVKNDNPENSSWLITILVTNKGALFVFEPKKYTVIKNKQLRTIRV